MPELYDFIENEIIMAEASEVEVGDLSDDYLDLDDGQPTWEQEWEDFGECYSDDYPLQVKSGGLLQGERGVNLALTT